MNDVRCPRCGGANPPNAPFCGTCGAPLTFQPPVNQPPQPPYQPPPPPYQPPINTQPPPTSYYPPPVPGPKVMGEKTRWALGLGIASVFCCGPLTGVLGFILAKKDMDEIRAGRAPQLDEKWAQWAYYLNIIGLILWVIGVCFYWGRGGLGSF